MRKLAKGLEPPLLALNKAGWTTAFLADWAAGNKTAASRYRYREPEIKQSLEQETHNKCAYCETYFVGAPSEIDHISPTSVNPPLNFEWNNLTLACKDCNTPKNAYEQPEAPFLNPYQDEVEDFLFHAGPLVLPREPTAPGTEMTVRVLGLNNPKTRSRLMSAKVDRLERARLTVKLHHMEANAVLKAAYLKELKTMASLSAPFSAMVREYLRAQQIPV
jgi:hypothetical protein